MRLLEKNSHMATRGKDGEYIVQSLSNGNNISAFIIQGSKNKLLRVFNGDSPMYEFSKIEDSTRLLMFSPNGGCLFIAIDNYLMVLAITEKDSTIAPLCQIYVPDENSPVIGAFYCLHAIVYCTKDTMYSYNTIDDTTMKVKAPPGYTFKNIMNMKQIERDVYALCVHKGTKKLAFFHWGSKTKLERINMNEKNMMTTDGHYMSDFVYKNSFSSEGCIVAIADDPKTKVSYLTMFYNQQANANIYMFSISNIPEELNIKEDVNICNIWPSQDDYVAMNVALLGSEKHYLVTISDVFSQQSGENKDMNIVSIFPDMPADAQQYVPLPNIIHSNTKGDTVISDSIVGMIDTAVVTMSTFVLLTGKYQDVFALQRNKLSKDRKDQDGSVRTSEMLEVLQAGRKNDIERLKREHDDKLKELETAHAADAKRTRVELTVELHKSQRTNGELIVELDSATRVVNQLKVVVDDMKKRNKQLSKNNVSKADFEKEKKNAQDLKEKLAEIETKMTDTEKEVAGLKRSLEEKNEMYQNVCKKLNAKEDKLKKSSIRNKELGDMINNLKNELQTAKSVSFKDVEMLKSMYDTEKEKLDAEWSEKLAKSETKWSGKLTGLGNDKKELSTTLDETQKELEETQKKLEETKKELHKMKNDFDNAKASWKTWKSKKKLTADKQQPQQPQQPQQQSQSPPATECENCQIMADKFGKYMALNPNGEKPYNPDLIALQFKYAGLEESYARLVQANQAISATLGQTQALLMGILPSGMPLQEFFDKVHYTELAQEESAKLKQQNLAHLTRIAELETKLMTKRKN